MQPGVGGGEGVYEEGSQSTGSADAELHVQRAAAVQQRAAAAQQCAAAVAQAGDAGMQPGVGGGAGVY
eukprot:840440-Rhodomonas_salina.1